MFLAPPPNRTTLSPMIHRRDRKGQPEAEPATNLENLLFLLKNNQVSELRLGWQDCDFLTSKRSALSIARALKQNTSVSSVNIGWKRFSRDSLVIILRAASKYCKLQSFKLVRDDWVPDRVLSDLLSSQIGLVNLDLQAVFVLSKQQAIEYEGTKRYSWRIDPTVDSCVVSQCLVHQYHQLQQMKSLCLVDCQLTDEKVICLADFLHIRGGLSKLSLRSNRLLTGRGLRIICQAPVMRSLDISLCDLDTEDAQEIAQGIATRPWPVGKLLLDGNYRIGTMGLLCLTRQKVCQKIVSLSMNYCDNKDYQAVLVLNALASLKPDTTLQRIALHGSMAGNDVVVVALEKLLSQSNCLRSIQLNDPQSPKPMKPNQLRRVLSGLRENYEIEELCIDSLRYAPEENAIWKEIDFFLRLNTAGRRVVKPEKPLRVYPGFPAPTQDDWFQVLEKAGQDDLTVLFWIVRQSAYNFGSFRSCKK